MANFVPNMNMQGEFILTAGEFALIGPGITVSNMDALGIAVGGSGCQITNAGTLVADFPVYIAQQSVLVNQPGGSIIGGHVGAYSVSASAIIDNAGSVFGNGVGVAMLGGTLKNAGTITSGHGVWSSVNAAVALLDGTNTVQNSGAIKPLKAGAFGIYTHPDAIFAKVTNSGSIAGGISFGDGDDLYAGAAGRLSGKVFGLGGADTITGGIDNDWFEGGNENDTLNGNGGADRLFGQNGKDTLNGGLGKDLLTGGASNDTFRFTAKTHSAAGVNADRIMDFDDPGMGNDKIDLSALFGPKMVYLHDGAFTASGQVRINDVAGADVIVEVNTGGSLAADFSVRLVGTTLASMAVSDFVL